MDVNKRLAMHQKGKGARYTRMKAPVTLVYYEELADRKAALKREIQIKRMPHECKRKLAEEFLKNQAEI